MALLPSAVQFQELLHNSTFVDFLNMFLNLPAFPCRLFYRKSLESFEVDSVAFHNDMLSLTFEQERLMGWLLDSRVAFYYKTELYRECTLAMKLSDPHQAGDAVGGTSPTSFLLCTTSTCLVEQFGDSVRSEMSTIAGLKNFRAFLRGTTGEHLVSLYLDIMKVYLCQDQLKQQNLLHKVSERYLCTNSKRILPPDVRQLLQVSIRHCSKQETARWRAGEINLVLDEIMEAVFCRLHCYWYRRYLVHRAVIKCHMKSEDTLQRLCDVCRSVLITDKAKMKLYSFTSRDVKNCDCCAITDLISCACADSQNYVDDQASPSLHNDLDAAKSAECSKHVVVMGSFDSKMHLSRTLLQDVTSDMWTQEARALTAALISDQYAGSPFGCYLQQRSKTLASNCLLLWLDALDLIQSWGQPEILWDEKIQHFLDTFVESESEFDCELPASLKQHLDSLLPLGCGKEYLVQAQEHVLKSLRLEWSKYAARDLDCFWTNVNSGSRTAFNKLLGKRPYLPRTTSKSPLADSARPASISGLSVSSYRCWRALVLVRPQWDRGLCELHGVSGVTSCGSVTSLGSRRGPAILTTDQLERVRLKLEEERLRKVRESRIIRLEKKAEKVDQEKPSLLSDVGVAANRLTRPKQFHQVLLNFDYREHFRCFLTMQDAEIPLQFWVAVYEMKRHCRTHTEAQETAKQIKRRFFSKAMRRGAALQCKEKLIADIGAGDDVSPADLFKAASLVAQTLKKQWFSYYRNTLPPAEGDDEEDEEVIDVKSVMAVKPRLTRQRKTRSLWAAFIKRMCNFRRGLASKITRRAFKKFLNLQKFMSDGQRKPEYAMRKIMKNSQLINVSRLTYDLDFWVEVDKYKQMSDEAGMPWGEQTREEEAFIQRKAFAVINCFLDSVVPPKIQVNVTTDVVNRIVDNAACGTIKRGIFHHASLQIFNVLSYYWKRFCCHRAGLEAEVEKRSRRVSRPSLAIRNQLGKNDGSQTSGSSHKSKKDQTVAGDDEVVCITFSITAGIQYEKHRNLTTSNEGTVM